MWLVLVVCPLLVLPAWSAVEGEVTVDTTLLGMAARRVLREENEVLRQGCTRAIYAFWTYQTNYTEYNSRLALAAQMQYASLKKQSWDVYRRWATLQTRFSDESVKRQFEALSTLGTAALPVGDLQEYKNVRATMSQVYNSATVCSFGDAAKCGLTVEKDLADIMKNSRKEDELSYYWQTWRDKTGKNLRDHYKAFTGLENKVARYNGFRNKVDMSMVAYESGDFREQMTEVWEQIKPLYQQLHAYARRKLRQTYGSDVVTERGPIPAHLLGNMWAQKWEIKDILTPYPWRSPFDVTDELVQQGYTPRRLYEVAEEYFTSLNMTKMPYTFWTHSIFEKPKDREIICYSSAWDFCNSYDYRIKHCARVNMEDLIAAHKEMSHIQYFMHYKDQPYVFRSGANPGFHEAVSGAISLMASTQKHLQRIGLLKYLYNNYASDINEQMEIALDKLVYLPFAYSMDHWRWSVQDGSLEEKDWNCGWWDLRYEIQGLKPPVVRTELDFDPGSKFNIAHDLSYDKYFVGFIMRFQILKALCLRAGEYDPEDANKPLHKCDIYQSTEAGDLLSEGLRMGSSKPWRDVLYTITGERKLDASALREYFLPLEAWLKDNNARYDEFVGWRPDGEYCLYTKPDPTRTTCT